MTEVQLCILNSTSDSVISGDVCAVPENGPISTAGYTLTSWVIHLTAQRPYITKIISIRNGDAALLLAVNSQRPPTVDSHVGGTKLGTTRDE